MHILRRARIGGAAHEGTVSNIRRVRGREADRHVGGAAVALHRLEARAGDGDLLPRACGNIV